MSRGALDYCGSSSVSGWEGGGEGRGKPRKEEPLLWVSHGLSSIRYYFKNDSNASEN